MVDATTTTVAVVDMDKSRKKCRVGSASALQVEKMVVEELKHLAEDPDIVERVVLEASKEQSGKLRKLKKEKSALENSLRQIDKKAKNLLGVLGDGKKKGAYLVKELDDLDIQARQLRERIDTIEFELGGAENRIINAEVVRDNFKVFKDIYAHLTQEERYDLMHLLIKRATYTEKETSKGKEIAIKLEMYELPPLGARYRDQSRLFC